MDNTIEHLNNQGQESKVKLKLISISVFKAGRVLNRINNDSSSVQSVIKSLYPWPI